MDRTTLLKAVILISHNTYKSLDAIKYMVLNRYINCAIVQYNLTPLCLSLPESRKLLLILLHLYVPLMLRPIWSTICFYHWPSACSKSVKSRTWRRHQLPALVIYRFLAFKNDSCLLCQQEWETRLDANKRNPMSIFLQPSSPPPI